MNRTAYIDVLEQIAKASTLDAAKNIAIEAIAIDAREWSKAVSEVEVTITGRNAFAEMKIPAIRAIREITGCGLKEAKDAVEVFPHLLARNVPLRIAMSLRGQLRACGYEVKFNPETEMTEILY